MGLRIGEQVARLHPAQNRPAIFAEQATGDFPQEKHRVRTIMLFAHANGFAMAARARANRPGFSSKPLEVPPMFFEKTLAGDFRVNG